MNRDAVGLVCALTLLGMLLGLVGCGGVPKSDPGDQLPSWKYAPPPSASLSLADYKRVIFEPFAVHPSVTDPTPGTSFPELIQRKLSFFYPNAFEETHVGVFDRPGLVVSGYIIEFNPVQRERRLLPSGRGTAIFGVEIVLRDNLSHRELGRFSLRYPDGNSETRVQDVLDASAKEIASYLAFSRTR